MEVFAFQDDIALALHGNLSNALEAMKLELHARYGVTLDFLKRYAEFAERRSASDVVLEKMLLPDGFMDKNVYERELEEAAETFIIYDREHATVRAHLMDAFRSKKALMEIESDPVARSRLSEDLTDLVNEYCAFVLDGLKARSKLLRLCTKQPIDCDVFRREMDGYVRTYIVENLKLRCPGIAGKLMYEC